MPIIEAFIFVRTPLVVKLIKRATSSLCHSSWVYANALPSLFPFTQGQHLRQRANI
jgi:hypothetical protein